MAYIALKPVRFDKNYAIGDTIPDGVVDAARAAALETMKIIVKSETPAEPEATAEPEAATAPEATAEPEAVKTATGRKRAAAKEA